MNKIGKFEIEELLGRGAMGVVYKGYDPFLDRHVAIKVMTAHLEMDPELRTRFFREAQAAASLQHPNIITVFELGDSDGKPYIAMEFVPGRDLDNIISARQTLTVVEKVDLVEQVCRGLAYAHDRGIVHRDVKPANVRISEMGQAKVMDFGVAHLASSELTQTGSLMGTPYYMAPEVIEGKSVDARADVFSVGAMFYELLSYSRPFQGDSLQTVFHKILHTEPTPLRDLGLDVPPVLQEVLNRCLAKDPTQRYADMGELLVDLVKFWETVPAIAKTRSTAATALGSAARRTTKGGRSRNRWSAVVAGTVGVLTLVGVGALVWRTVAPGTSGRPGAVAETSTASAQEARRGGDDAAAPTQGDVAGTADPVASDAGERSGAGAGEPDASPGATAARDAADEPAPTRRPEVDRTAVQLESYRAALREADRGRTEALTAGVEALGRVASFERAESLRGAAASAARAGRYVEARERATEARRAYADARFEALEIWNAKLDSARASLVSLRSAADPSAPGYAEAVEWDQRARSAEQARDFDVALAYLGNAASGYRRAAAAVSAEPAPSETAPPTVAERPSAREIAEAVLIDLGRAIESKDLDAIRRTWVSLTPAAARSFEQSFDIMSDIRVDFEVTSIRMIGDRVHVGTVTTYHFYNESSRKREQTTFEQQLELEERGDRWVVVDSRG